MVVGAALGATAVLLVGAILLATKAAHLGSSSPAAAATDQRAISLPTQLAGFQDAVTAAQQRGAKGASLDGLRSRVDHTRTRTVAAYRDAFGGAGTAVQVYSDTALEFQPTVVAVRAPSPALLTGPVTDPADLGLAVAQQSTIALGPTQCSVARVQPVRVGGTVDDNDIVTPICHRSGPALSVWVYGLGRGRTGQQDMARLTDAAYQAAGG